MNAIDPGYEYELAYHEPCEESPQLIQFIKKEPVGVSEFKTSVNGTTNEEVLAMLIHRLKFQSAKLPSRETSIVITKLEEALMWLNKRTAERKERGVENTPKV